MLLARLGTPAPIRYVQDAILNLRHPESRAVVTPDYTVLSNCQLKKNWHSVTPTQLAGV